MARNFNFWYEYYDSVGGKHGGNITGTADSEQEAREIVEDKCRRMGLKDFTIKRV
jgi:hypothetical protein